MALNRQYLRKMMPQWFRLILAEINNATGAVSKDVLDNTPDRVAKAYLELLSGYDQKPNDIITVFDQQTAVVYECCEFYSLCEHHMLPFFGKVHIGYIPSGKVVGLSKLARLVECFSRRLQIQERLTEQIANALYFNKELKPFGVFVLVEAQHLCMMMRGIKKQDSKTKTIAVRGAYDDRRGKKAHRLREEFLMILRSKKGMNVKRIKELAKKLKVKI